MIALGRVAVLAAVAAAGISLWLAAEPLVSRVLGRGEALALGQGGGAREVAALQVDLAPVLAFAPFGVAEGAGLVVARDESALGLTLLGITVAEPDSGSRAMIAGGDLAVASYGVGAQISGGVVLMAVRADHVVVSVDGQEAELRFADTGAVVAAAGAGAGVDLYNLAAGNLAADAGVVAEGDLWLGQYRAEIQNDFAGLLARLGLEAGDQGYLVLAAAPGEVLAAGFRPGDVVRAVNGAQLGDPAADAALFDAVASAGQASVAVQRDGKTITMTFPLR